MAERPKSQEAAEADGLRQFLREVLPAEKKYLQARRRAASVGADRPLDPSAGPTTDDEIVGVALSGGGIRSAAFNLGVLQALHRRGILKHADYLSTVSGGGWIGAALQALLATGHGDERPADFPFEARRDAGPSPALGHLRDQASSLVPLGLGGGVRALSLLLRSQMLTWSLLVPVVLFLVCVSAPILTVYVDRSFVRHGLAHRPLPPDWIPPWAWFTDMSRYPLGLAVAWMAVSMVVISLVPLAPAPRRQLERSVGVALGYALLAVALELHLYVVVRWYRGVMYPPGGHSLDRTRVLQLALAAVAGTYLFTAVARRVRALARPLMLAVAFGLTVAVPYVAYLVAVSAFMRRFPTGDSDGWMTDALAPSHWPTAALAAFLFANVLNANSVSLHHFYRGRLSRMFLLRSVAARDGGAARVEPAESLRLSEINREGSWAPYALINAALNLQGIDDSSLHGRQCDFFVFSRRFVGSHRVGYCPTETMEKAVHDLDLGTAMAISGAAVAPNMGTYTSRAAVSLMTFLNIRLGYWLPHPDQLAGAGEVRGLSRLRWYPAGLASYLRELFSSIDDRGDLVFLTDGGHLENSGVYELLRRRCKVIIASDAEEDPAMQFGGLAALVRYARISLQTEIELDVRALRPDARGFSTRHVAVGAIRYPAAEGVPSQQGVLIYVKSALTDDEDVLIAEYRARNADFPHQSTADQVFDEAQFEAYRSLGYHSVIGASEGATASPASPLDAWRAELTLGANATQ